jgi:hypothetical protein
VKHYLVVANRTLGGHRLRDAIEQRATEGSCHFHVLVPASRPREPLDETLTGAGGLPGDADSVQVGEEKLELELDWLRNLGVSASGEVTDPDPVVAIDHALEQRAIDEILLSTPPAGPSSWLHLDLPSRVERAADVPVTTLIED